MSSRQNSGAGVRGWYVAAVALAAGAGYWYGSVWQDTPTERTTGVAPTGENGDRVRDSKISSPARGGFVQALLSGSIEERQVWQHVRSFAEAEVKVAIGDLEKLGRPSMASPDLLEMLYYRWAELDPVAANAAATNVMGKGPVMNPFPSSRQAVIAAWINQGGAVEAWDAVRGEDEVWDCTLSVPGEVADMLVASLSDRDDATAFKEVLRMHDENSLIAENLCRARAGKASRSPESRAAFLAAAATHPEPYVREFARDQLFEEWAKRDVTAARAGVLAMSLDEEEREALGGLIDSVERNKIEEADQ